MKRDILPDRLLRVTRRHRNARTWALSLLGIAAVALTAVFIVTWRKDAAAIDREVDVWERGIGCEDGSSFRAVGDESPTVSIECVSEGRVLRGTLKMPGMKLKHFPSAIEARYDPDDPTSFALSAGIDQVGRRRTVIFVAMLLLEGCVLGIFGVFIGVVLVNLLRSRRLGREGDEMDVVIEHVWTKWNGNAPSHKRIVGWRIGPGEKLRKTTLDAEHGLAWVDGESQRALALVAPNRRYAVLLTADFHDLDLTNEERAAAMQRLVDTGGGKERPLLEVGTLIKQG